MAKTGYYSEITTRSISFAQPHKPFHHGGGFVIAGLLPGLSRSF